MILLQIIQNAVAGLQSSREPTLHFFLSLSALATGYSSHQVQACIQNNHVLHTLLLSHALTSLLLSRSLRPESEEHLVIQSQKCTKSHSRTFSLTVPRRWNDLPTPTLNASRKTIHLCFHFFLFTPCSSLYFSERCWKHCINSTSCILLPIYDDKSRIPHFFRSLRTKASAKWINIYVNAVFWSHKI